MHSNPYTLFPPEIWQQIFGYIEAKRDMKRLCLVCTHFYDTIKPILWKTPKLRGFTIKEFYMIHELPIYELDTAKFKGNMSPNSFHRQMTFLLFKLIGRMRMLRSLTLSEIVVYNTRRVLMELAGLENIRSLTFRNVRIRCGECGVLMKWKNCGEVIKELLQRFQHLQQFHFYDRMHNKDDVTTVAHTLTRMRNISKLTLTDVSEDVCKSLAQMESLQELQILVYKHLTTEQTHRLKSVFYEYREPLPACKLLIKDIFEVAA